MLRSFKYATRSLHSNSALKSTFNSHLLRNKWAIDEREKSVIVTMNTNAVNCINMEFFNDLNDTMERLEKDIPNHKPVLLTGPKESRTFSAGLDLKSLLTHDTQESALKFVHQLNNAFEKWYLMKRPTVAIINGHAIAGGMILALCNDFQVFVKNDKKKLVFLKEVELGLPFPGKTFEIIKKTIPERELWNATALAKTYDSETADKVFSHVYEGDFEGAIDYAENIFQLHSMELSIKAYCDIKSNLKRFNTSKEVLENADKQFVDCFFQPKVQKFIHHQLL